MEVAEVRQCEFMINSTAKLLRRLEVKQRASRNSTNTAEQSLAQAEKEQHQLGQQLATKFLAM